MNNKNFLKPVPALICGALIISFSSILVNISHVPPTVSAFYRCLFGSLTLIIACIIKKEFTFKSFKKKILAITCGFIEEKYIAGIGFGLATALFYGMFLLLLRQLQSDDKDFSLFYYLMLLTVVCTFFLGLKAYICNEPFTIPGLSTLVALISLGVFIQALAWVMISNALPHVKASHGGLILLLQPTLAFTWDVIIFNRPTSVTSWAGVLIVIVAIYMGMGGTRKKT